MFCQDTETSGSAKSNSLCENKFSQNPSTNSQLLREQFGILAGGTKTAPPQSIS